MVPPTPIGAPGEAKPELKLLGKSKPGPEEIMNTVGPELSRLNRRISLIENRIDSMQDHLELVDNNLIEKHKSTITEIRSVQTDTRTLQAQIHELSELLKRVASRLPDFASRDDIRVMEKYMSYWSPLAFTTKDEVEGLIKSAIEHIGAGASKEEIERMVKSSLGKSKPDSGKPGTPAKGSEFLTKKEVETLIVDALENLPTGKLEHEKIKTITKKHIEDLFGKF